MATSVGTVIKPWVSAISTLLDQREIWKQVVDVQMDDEWLSFLEDSNRRTLFSPQRIQSQVPIYYSFYDNPLYTLIDTTGATITGSGTTSISVTGLPSASQNYLVVGDLIRTPAGASARVQTVPSGSSFTAQSVNATVLTVVAGNKLSVYSNAQEEGALGPTPRRWDVSQLSNVIQYFKTAIKVTDVQQNSGVEVNINGKPSFLSYEIIRGLQKHRGDISLAFWLGDLGSTLFSDASPTLSGAQGYGVQTTRGMDSYIVNYGVNDSVTTPGVITLDDMTDLTAQMTAARAPLEYMEVGNQQAITVKSNFLKNLPSSGATNSVRMMANGRELDFEVTKYEYGGYTFNMRRLNVLSNSEVINYVASGSTKPSVARSIYYLPMGKIGSVGAGNQDYFRYRYMAAQSGPGGTGNAEIAEVMTGMLAPVPTDDISQLKVTWASNMGLEVVAPQKFVKQIVL